LGCADATQLRRLALEACDSGEDFLEIRLDLLQRPESGIAVIQRLLRRYPETVILATCRRTANGGQFKGTIEQELELLDAAISAGAAVVDVEIESAEAAPERLEMFRGRALLLLSYHNFEQTPPLARVVIAASEWPVLRIPRCAAHPRRHPHRRAAGRYRRA
jgi:3-dehydroquinate dehydratase/shikimate dehydrogenase